MANHVSVFDPQSKPQTWRQVGLQVGLQVTGGVLGYRWGYRLQVRGRRGGARGPELTRLRRDADGGALQAVLQLGVDADPVRRVGLQVAETVSAGSSAQPRLLFLTVCRRNSRSGQQDKQRRSLSRSG